MSPFGRKDNYEGVAVQSGVVSNKSIVHKSCVGPCRHRPEEVRCAVCILDSSDYFSGLGMEAKLALQRIMKLRYFSKQETIFTEGSACLNLAFLMSGSLKIFKSQGGGRQQIHRLVSVPGDIIGCEDIYSNKLGSTAQALTNTVLCIMEKNDFNRVASEHPDISSTLLQAMARNLNAYIQHTANLGQKQVIERVASYLMLLHETHTKRGLQAQQLAETLSRAELADLLGTTQRTLIRSLKKLEQDKLISLNKQGFQILDYAQLARVAEGESL